MNIVNSGERFMVYGEEVKTYKELPANTYRLCCDPMSGFYLTLHNDLEVNEKVYGLYAKKVDKVMHTFSAMERNMGIILSGPKGVGKSVFARLLAEEGKKHNLPLILIMSNMPGLADFISSIHQECIVLFDEFEKTFKSSGRNELDSEPRNDPQTALLSLFDGIDNGKKLYVVTCNDTRELNSYLLNRPGRFHYHFVLNAPNDAEVTEYLQDNLNDDAKKYITDLVALSNVSSFTYDILRAVVFDLNQGYDLDETLNDLNIERERRVSFMIKAEFSNGIIAETSSPVTLDLTDRARQSIWLDFNRKAISPEIYKYCNDVGIYFYLSDVGVNANGYFISPDDVEIRFENEIGYISEDDVDAKALKSTVDEFTASFDLTAITLTRVNYNDYVYKNFTSRWLA